MMNLKELLDETDRLKTELDQLRPIPEDRMERLMQKLRLDWDYNSNSIEGNTLSLNETRALIQFGLTAKGKPIRDHLEMRGHHEALKKLEQLIRKQPEDKPLKITESLIKEFHALITAEPHEEEGVEIRPGEFKKFPNYILTSQGERMDFSQPEQVNRLMSDLINWLNNHLYSEELNRHTKKKYAEHPLILACLFHKRFIMIHPFGDGNGRMARILTNLILMQNGYMPAIVRTEQKQDYYNALNTSSEEDATPLVEYVANQEIESLKLAIKAAKGESISEPADLDKELEMLDRMLVGLEEEEVKEVKSPENIRKVIELSVVPLAEKMKATFEKINKYYHVAELSIFVDGGGTTLKEESLTTYLLKRLQERIETRDISLSFRWEGFIKAGLNAFNDSYGVKFDFKQHKYLIQIGYENRPSIEKLYTQFLSDKEIEEIALEAAKSRVNYIIEKLEHLKQQKG
jgi:Fic family protein